MLVSPNPTVLVVFSAIATILITSGYSTVRPTDLPLEQLQEKIVSGEIIKPGDYATIITADGKRHSLKVLTATQVQWLAGLSQWE